MKRSFLSFALIVVLLLCTLVACKPKAKISEKSKQLFGGVWTYDAEATRTEVMKKAKDATGIKNLDEIKLEGDVKTMADAVSAKTLYFAADKEGRGIGYIRTTGKGILQNKVTGWMKWNADETAFTLEPPDAKGKPLTYKLIELTANRLVILSSESSTDTPEVYIR